MESSPTAQEAGAYAKSQHPSRSGAPKYSPTHLAPTIDRATTTNNSSRITALSRLISKSSATHWPPSRALQPLCYTQVSPVNRSLDIHYNRTTRILAPPQTQPVIHSTLGQDTVSVPSVERQSAWEEKQSTFYLPLKGGMCTDAEQLPRTTVEDTESLPQVHKKSVSFSRKLPTYRKTNGQPSSNRHKRSATLPRIKKSSGIEMDSPTEPTLDGPPLGTEDKLLKDQVTHTAAVCDVKEKQRLQLSRGRQRLHNQISTLSGMQYQPKQTTQDSQMSVGSSEQRLADKTKECSSPQAELNAKTAEVESEESLEKSKHTLLQAQVESLQIQLNKRQREMKEMKTKLATQTHEKRRLQLSIQMEKEDVKQELMSCMRDLASTQEQNASLQQRIATLNRELASSRHQLTKAQRTEKVESLQKLLRLSQQEFDHLQRSFSVEQQRYVALQEEKLSVINSELEKCQKKVAKGKTENSKMREAHAMEPSSRGESVDGTLAAEGRDLIARNAMLSADHSCAQEIQHELEKKITLLEQTLQNQDTSSRRVVSDLEAELRKAHTAHALSEAQLSQMKDKCQSLESSLETSFSTQVNGSQVRELEIEVYEAKLQLAGLNTTLEFEKSTSTSLKDELDCYQQECSALQDQLELQRQLAALSLNRAQQSSYKKKKVLVQRIKELQRKLKEAQAAEKEAKSKCLVHVAELSHETAQLEKVKQANTLLHSELKEKKTSLRLAKQHNHELSGRIEEEKAIQVSIQNELSHEVEAHLECQALLSQHQESLEAAERERDQLNHSLAEKLALVEHEQQHITALQLLMSQTKQQLSAAKQTMRQRHKESQTHLKLLKRDHQNQMRVVTSQLQELRCVSDHLQEKENMVMELERAREALQTECRQLQARLDQVDKEHTEEMEKNSNLSAENSSLKTRLSDLQKMVSELTVAQREYEDYAHKLEQTTKSEMHQMFEEMTHHIQQQSDSHKYLEKLQIENEKLALQEKERQIHDLRQDSVALQKQRKQEEVLIETLKFENQLLKAQLRGRQTREAEVSTRRDMVCSSGSVTSDKLPPIHQHSVVGQRHKTLKPHYL